MILACLICGTALAIAGFYGPQDDGFLELCGLALIGFAVYVYCKQHGIFTGEEQ